MRRRSKRGRSSRSDSPLPAADESSEQDVVMVGAERRIRLRAEAYSSMQSILPIVGMLFLIFGVLDYLFLLAPMDFMNPLWELRLFGQLVDHVWGPLFGLALILAPFSNTTTVVQLKTRAFLSWAALILAICYIFLLPFGLVTGNRIYEGLKQVRDTATVERNSAVELAMDELYAMQSIDEIRARTSSLGLKDSVYAEPELDKLKNEIETKYRQLHAERMETLTSNYAIQVRSLAITLTKSVVGALVATAGFGFLFFKTRNYRQLVKLDKLGKGGAAGISETRRKNETEAEEALPKPQA